VAATKLAPPSPLLPLREKVARPARAETDEGLAWMPLAAPSPAALCAAPSPARGEGGAGGMFRERFDGSATGRTSRRGTFGDTSGASFPELSPPSPLLPLREKVA